MTVNKFEVKIEYTVTETHEINTRDADSARIIAENGVRAPINREVSRKNTLSVKQTSPRYAIVTDYAGNNYGVFDTRLGIVVGEMIERRDAQMVIDVMNAKEEAK